MKLDRRTFKQGFVTVFPLWVAAIPVALAYVTAAQDAGLNWPEIQLMSLTVYSASAQIAAVQLLAVGAPVFTILATAGVLNLHFLLYGLSLTRRIRFSRIERAIAAYILTDAAYGVTIPASSASFSFLFGAGLSLYLAWNLLTALAILLGHMIAIPASAHLEFAAPLTFFLLLVSTAKTRLDYGIVGLSAVAVVVCRALQLGSATIPIVGVAGALVGAWALERKRAAA
jgi:predicted branched-subunit amino acid permease